MDCDLLMKLYKALVRPIVDYGNVIWYPYTKKNKKLIENIQRRATRMIPELKGLSYTDRLQHFKLFSMDYRRKRGDMIQLFKILNGFENIDAQTMFTFATSQTRGHNKNYISQDVQRDLDNTLSVYAVLTHGTVFHRMLYIRAL